MSELTRCNYCTLQRIREIAKKRGVGVILGRQDGWTVVRYSDEDEPVAHLLEVTDHCVC